MTGKQLYEKCQRESLTKTGGAVKWFDELPHGEREMWDHAAAMVPQDPKPKSPGEVLYESLAGRCKFIDLSFGWEESAAVREAFEAAAQAAVEAWKCSNGQCTCPA